MSKAGQMGAVAFIFILFLCFFSCSDPPSDTPAVIARVNGYELTGDEFHRKLVQEMEYSNEYKTTPEAKRKFLDSLISKELLIQDAQKKGIDKTPEFISAIERYWEATLIKHLMEEKGREILKIAIVSEKEIKEKYLELKGDNPDLQEFETLEKEIALALGEIKKTELLDQWMEGLRSNAKITIDSKFIEE